MKTYISLIVCSFLSLQVLCQPPAPLDTNALTDITKEHLYSDDFNDFYQYIHSKEINTSDLIHLLNHDSHQIRFQIFRILHLRPNTPSPVDIVKKHINDNPEATFIRSCTGNDGIMDMYIMMMQRGFLPTPKHQLDSINLVLLSEPNQLASKYRCFTQLQKEDKQALALAKKLAYEEEVVTAIVPLAKYDFDTNKEIIIKLLKKWLYVPTHTYLPYRYHYRRDLETFFYHTKMDDDIYQIMIDYKNKQPHSKNIVAIIDRALQQRADFGKTLELQKQFYALGDNSPNEAQVIFRKLESYLEREHANDPFFEDFYFDLWRKYRLSSYKIKSVLTGYRKPDMLNHLYQTLPNQIANIKSEENLYSIKRDIEWYVENEAEERVVKVILALNNHSDSIVKDYSLQQAALWSSTHKKYQKEIISVLLDECNNDDEKFQQYLFSFIMLNEDTLNKKIVDWYKRHGQYIEDENYKKHISDILEHYGLLEK